MTMEIYVCNAHLVASEIFENEIVVIQFDTGKYFSLRGVALQIWQLLQAPVTPSSMALALSEAAGATSPGTEAMAAEIDTVIARFMAEGLIIPADTAGSAPAIEPFTYAPASIETYSDLADLVSLDPIHDVNAMMGWPRAGAA